MYSDICMCVLYTYAAVKRFLIWCAGPDESNGIFFFFSFFILIPPQFYSLFFLSCT